MYILVHYHMGFAKWGLLCFCACVFKYTGGHAWEVDYPWFVDTPACKSRVVAICFLYLSIALKAFVFSHNTHTHIVR